jgi:hypothetical protein
MKITEALEQLHHCWFDSMTGKIKACGLPTLKDEYNDLLFVCKNKADKLRLEQAYLNHTKDLSYEQEKLYKGHLEIIRKANPDYFVTLTFANNNTSEQYALNTMGEFIKRVEQRIYPKGAPPKILIVLVFLERNQSNGIHFHLLIKEPVTTCNHNLKDVLQSKWLSLDHSGYANFNNKSWFQKIYELDGIAKYITKQTYGNNNPFIAEHSNF